MKIIHLLLICLLIWFPIEADANSVSMSPDSAEAPVGIELLCVTLDSEEYPKAWNGARNVSVLLIPKENDDNGDVILSVGIVVGKGNHDAEYMFFVSEHARSAMNGGLTYGDRAFFSIADEQCVGGRVKIGDVSRKFSEGNFAMRYVDIQNSDSPAISIESHEFPLLKFLVAGYSLLFKDHAKKHFELIVPRSEVQWDATDNTITAFFQYFFNHQGSVQMSEP